MGKNCFFDDFEEFTKEINFDFSKHSTIGVGGVAKIAFYPEDETRLKLLINRLKEKEIGYIVVGNMSNVLPSDKPSGKAIISTKKMIASQIGQKTYFSAGIMSGCLLRACRYAQKSGVEFLAGIPCTLGGALYMNAGVNGRYIAEIVDKVVVYRDGEVIELKTEECGYAYKNSLFMQTNDIILGAFLRLTDSDIKSIREQEIEYLKRRSCLPKGKSMGCVFKNVEVNGERMSAGMYIDRAGLKGARCGGAYVSQEHANFIINDGSATAIDICSLISHIKQEVYARYQIVLQEEIRYLE